MFTRFTTRAIRLLLPLVITSAVLAYHYGQAQPLPINPYLPYLASISPQARCYGDVFLYSSYCTQQTEGGYLAWSLDNEGAIKSFSTRGVFDTRVGDFWAIYGVPDRTHTARYYVTYVWDINGLRVLIMSRHGTLHERVRWVLFARGVG